MPKSKDPQKTAIDMTTGERAKRLFPPRVLKRAKDIAHQGEWQSMTTQVVRHIHGNEESL